MRRNTAINRRCGAALALLAACAGPVSAQQPAQPRAPAPLLDLTLPPAADSGKPRPFALPTEPAAPGCEAFFDCRLKIIGAVRHDGAVELNAALFKW